MFFSFGDVLGASTWQADLQSDWSQDVIDAGRTVKDKFGGMFQNYAFEQILDHSWAGDWSEADDLYRGSAEWSAGTGSWSDGTGTGGGASGHAYAGAEPSVLGGMRGAFKDGARGVGVYIIFDAEGKIAYAGRTGRDMGTRVKEHLARWKSMGIDTSNWRHAGVVIKGKQARRGVEHMVLKRILGQSGVMARIGGIAANNPKAARYLAAGARVLGRFR